MILTTASFEILIVYFNDFYEIFGAGIVLDNSKQDKF